MSEYSRIMLALVTVCGLVAASAVWPVIDVVLTAGLLTLAGGLVAGSASGRLRRLASVAIWGGQE